MRSFSHFLFGIPDEQGIHCVDNRFFTRVVSACEGNYGHIFYILCALLAKYFICRIVSAFFNSLASPLIRAGRLLLRSPGGRIYRAVFLRSLGDSLFECLHVDRGCGWPPAKIWLVNSTSWRTPCSCQRPGSADCQRSPSSARACLAGAASTVQQQLATGVYLVRQSAPAGYRQLRHGADASMRSTRWTGRSPALTWADSRAPGSRRQGGAAAAGHWIWFV